MGWLCVLKTLHVTLAKSGSRRIGKRITGQWSSSRNARRLLRRGRMIPWTIPSNYTLQRTDFKPRPSRRRSTGRLGWRTNQRVRTSRPTRPYVPMTLARQCLLVCRWWLDPPGPMAHPRLGGLITIVGTVMIANTMIITGDRQDTMAHLGLTQLDVTCPGGTRAVSGHTCHPHRVIPAEGRGTVLIQRPIWGQPVSCGGWWNPSSLSSHLGLRLISDPYPLSHPGLRLITDLCPLSIISDSMMEIRQTIRDLHMSLGMI